MNKKIQYIILVMALLALLTSIVNYFSIPKIGAVDFKRLITEYQGMKDATMDYEKKIEEWNKMTDSLSNDIKNELSDYYADSALLSKDEMIKRETKIIAMRNKYVEFTQGLDANAEKEDQKMTSEVVNKVLSFVNKYGVKNGYDIIHGKNEGNFVLYKSVEIDITDELIHSLNVNYEGY